MKNTNKTKQIITLQTRGFSLLELLMTILIIGILAAIAVSAYNHALLKSRFSSIIPPTKSVAQFQEFYYLNNGTYSTNKEALDVNFDNMPTAVLTLSDKKNYKYVMGSNTKVPGASYIVYQKHSKRFADNIHCQAAEDNRAANWLCEKGLGGTLLNGSISGAGFLTYLLAGDAGNDKFIREDCRVGWYDNQGECTKAPAGSYAEDGELKPCPEGTASSQEGATKTNCRKCPVGTYSGDGATKCTACPTGSIAVQGQASCTQCKAGTYTDTWRCINCPNGTYSGDGATKCTACPAGSVAGHGQASCTQCPDGTRADTWRCIACPAGTTSNADHTKCI